MSVKHVHFPLTERQANMVIRAVLCEKNYWSPDPLAHRDWTNLHRKLEDLRDAQVNKISPLPKEG